MAEIGSGANGWWTGQGSSSVVASHQLWTDHEDKGLFATGFHPGSNWEDGRGDTWTDLGADTPGCVYQEDQGGWNGLLLYFSSSTWLTVAIFASGILTASLTIWKKIGWGHPLPCTVSFLHTLWYFFFLEWMGRGDRYFYYFCNYWEGWKLWPGEETINLRSALK